MSWKVINLRSNPVRESLPGHGVIDIPGNGNQAGLDNFVILEHRDIAFGVVDGLNNTSTSGPVLAIEEVVGDSEVVKSLGKEGTFDFSSSFADSEDDKKEFAREQKQDELDEAKRLKGKKH